MNYSKVNITIDRRLRKLCFKPYPGHRKGCPNFGKKAGCPPQVPMINKLFDLSKPVWAIWNVFDLAAHCDRMREAHPDWSKRQVECCLYWQPTARKQLYYISVEFLQEHKDKDLMVISCPEACGVNVTKTMLDIGHELEWPPVTKTYQVLLAGTRIRKSVRKRRSKYVNE